MGSNEREVPRPISEVLQPAEALLWWDRPSPWAYMAGSLMVTLPLGLIAVGCTCAWIRGTPLAELPPWAWIVLGLVLLLAAHMLALRPLLSLLQARGMYYAITSRRALVVCSMGRRTFQELHHDRPGLVVLEGPGGLCKIQFCRSAASSLDVLIFGRAAIPGFYGLRDPRSALAVLASQRKEASAAEKTDPVAGQGSRV